MIDQAEEWQHGMAEKGRRAERSDLDPDSLPSRQPSAPDEEPPIDVAPVPPLTAATETEGG